MTRGGSIKYRHLTLLIAMSFALAACNTHTTTSVSKPGEKPSVSATEPDVAKASVATPDVTSDRTPTNPADVTVTKDDITDRPYEVIGDIKVTVSKTTIFNSDPTPAMVDARLKEKAGELGADAVILVRYGSVGVSFTSWGSLNGQGRAVFFPK
jgi:uncharacterized protein YbjQ (UPF0145 family)